ncbi:indolepyruvate ferredoxin oxidoreductase subunit alpha [Candidatus Poribacteria bacterium]|nr:indolepyruvate ferredoxin oxidoreductase subunit alpha [Candidatus Poribacteria bacterium]
MKVILSGNEALARGVYESGVSVAAAYPGTPSTEILETIASQYPEIYAEWSPNEKVAFEVGMGCSFAGGRALVAMKHVGVNVAADPLFTLSYTGIKGGFVLISADDPGMHSSQNEQDNRYYAKFAKVPLLEPSDSQEAKDFLIQAFQISETFDTPVMLRITTRIAHSKSIVELGEKLKLDPPSGFIRDCKKYVMIPAYARQRHKLLEERLEKLLEYSEESPFQKMEMRDEEIGVITSGISYQYTREVLPNASTLKLGMTYPLPDKLIKKFANQVKKLYIVEELEPYLEEYVRKMGLAAKWIDQKLGELSSDLVAEFFHKENVKGVIPLNKTNRIDMPLPARPPVMCPGCPHRSVFYTLKKKKLTVTGDIGCYTLSVLPPLEIMDTCVCMGASIGSAMGVEKATKRSDNLVAVIGDSTFVHSGITGLIDMVYNKSKGTVIILDNETTAMTGRQDHPGTGVTLMGEETKRLNFIDLAKALGIEYVRTIDPYNLKELETVIDEAVNLDKLAVLVTNQPCILLRRVSKPKTAEIDQDLCIGCHLCLRLGCPAMSSMPEKQDAKDRQKVQIDPMLCSGCMICASICRSGAITEASGK